MGVISNADRAAIAALPVADETLRKRVIGHYADGATFVVWFKSNSLDGRRWEIVAESLEQVGQDEAEAYQYMLMPTIVTKLQDIEIRLDAALHPVFDMDCETAITLVTESHAELRKLLGMAPVEEVQS